MENKDNYTPEEVAKMIGFYGGIKYWRAVMRLDGGMSITDFSHLKPEIESCNEKIPENIRKLIPDKDLKKLCEEIFL